LAGKSLKTSKKTKKVKLNIKRSRGDHQQVFLVKKKTRRTDGAFNAKEVQKKNFEEEEERILKLLTKGKEKEHRRKTEKEQTGLR